MGHHTSSFESIIRAGGMLDTVGRSRLPTVQQFPSSGCTTACPIGELVLVGTGKNANKQCQPLSFFASDSGQWGTSECVRNFWGNVGFAFHTV
jgi:hypothetical protein